MAKPKYQKGDYIEVAGHIGLVQSICSMVKDRRGIQQELCYDMRWYIKPGRVTDLPGIVNTRLIDRQAEVTTYAAVVLYGRDND